MKRWLVLLVSGFSQEVHADNWFWLIGQDEKPDTLVFYNDTPNGQVVVAVAESATVRSFVCLAYTEETG